MTIRIGTWNLDRSGVRNKSRWIEQLAVMEARNANVWILTEAHCEQRIPGAVGVYSAPGQGLYKPEECASAVWARGEFGERLPVSDPTLSVCVETRLRGCDAPVIIYATVIPYAGDGAPFTPRWHRHRQGCDNVLADCVRVRAQRPNQPLVLAGDFNMNFDGTQWYGLREVKEQVSRTLGSIGLRCCTAVDIRSRDVPRASVDHIWISPEMKQQHEPRVWYAAALSDHNGIEVLIDFP